MEGRQLGISSARKGSCCPLTSTGAHKCIQQIKQENAKFTKRGEYGALRSAWASDEFQTSLSYLVRCYLFKTKQNTVRTMLLEYSVV